MKIYEEKEVSIKEFFEMCENSEGEYQIETPDGWKSINFLVRKKDRECYNLITKSGLELSCSDTHEILTEKRGWIFSKDINVEEDIILTKNGYENIVAKEYIGIENTYDLQVDSNEHRYYSNNIVSHNCGKSLICKAISREWNMPLLKLDFGKLFGSLVGDSEKNARQAILIAESVSPSVLWIDEVEKAISGINSSSQSDGGTTSRVLSTFLTWMNEKTSPVFVVATANNHESIPPEFLRPGRFDEIFYVDLPNPNERQEIFSIHLKKRKLDPKKFSLEYLADNSDGYSGAEIEKAIDNAMLIGFSEEKRKITTDDILFALKQFIPLSTMRAEDFEAIREWSKKRCVKANEEPKGIVASGGIGSKDLDV